MRARLARPRRVLGCLPACARVPVSLAV